ncbi:helix-turn-helix transcriptional regulator [Flaviaesturariibacter amylovorans]|uniref:Helix-turn-helix transcriptional regulator n=2 Tax=Flaviaesturariibacter amylovorans TaxID=1084520 RepID=A0ABP8H4S3_9BACT
MDTMETSRTLNHIGRKIVRIRELRGMKQDALARLLGVSQQAVSRLEQSEMVDEERLKAIADALGVTPEAIRQFNEEALFNNIQNNSDTSSNNSIVNYQFNPIDKIVELYERLLQSEREKVEMLQQIIDKK